MCNKDSFAEFFKELQADGVNSFEDFAKRLLDIWTELTEQIATQCDEPHDHPRQA